MRRDTNFYRALACILCGALSFTMLLPGAFAWAGLVLAVLAIALGWGAHRRTGRTNQMLSVGGIALAVLAALINLLTSMR